MQIRKKLKTNKKGEKFMPVLILLGIFGVWGAISINTTCNTNSKAYSKEELEAMSKQMIGKSEREARKVLRSYRK